MRRIKKFFGKVLDLIYPPFCVLCDEILPWGSDEVLCHACKMENPMIEGPSCAICSKPLQDLSKDRCLDCRRRVHFFDGGKALWVYEGTVKEAIRTYKFSKRQEMGVLFAKAMAKVYNEGEGWPVEMVLPVPIHSHKIRDRGFSQTQLLAKTFSEFTDIALAPKGALIRKKMTGPQEGLSDKERLVNVRGAFLADGKLVSGKTILLIDDVYTTGATMDSCAKALVDAGAGDVYFMAIAIGRGY